MPTGLGLPGLLELLFGEEWMDGFKVSLERASSVTSPKSPIRGLMWYGEIGGGQLGQDPTSQNPSERAEGLGSEEGITEKKMLPGLMSR